MLPAAAPRRPLRACGPGLKGLCSARWLQNPRGDFEATCVSKEIQLHLFLPKTQHCLFVRRFPPLPSILMSPKSIILRINHSQHPEFYICACGRGGFTFFRGIIKVKKQPTKSQTPPNTNLALSFNLCMCSDSLSMVLPGQWHSELSLCRASHELTPVWGSFSPEPDVCNLKWQAFLEWRNEKRLFSLPRWFCGSLSSCEHLNSRHAKAIFKQLYKWARDGFHGFWSTSWSF